ncbi:S-layer protein, partial [archaeon]|nr:S-layer protein [archaeon]
GVQNQLKVYWGTGASSTSVGTYQTIYPKLKGQKGQFIALTKPVSVTLTDGASLQFPTGALTLRSDGGGKWTFTAATNEDGTSSVITGVNGLNATTGNFNATAANTAVFALGKTANGGLRYSLLGTGAAAATLSVVGGSGNTSLSQPAIVFVEEEDDNKDINTVTVSLSTEASGSNNQASINSLSFSDVLASEISLGSDSNINYAADKYGTFAKHWTSSQDKVWLYYPDLQVSANIAALAKDATFSEGTTTSGSTVKTPNPIKTPLAKLDKEVVDADKTTKNLILVGGPVVNTLVRDLATSNKTWDGNRWATEGQGTAILQLVSDAFATGKSALVVAGYSAADTRTVANVLQQYDSHTSELTGKMLAVWKNGVISSTTA